MAKARKAKASRPKTVKQAKATAYNKKNKAVKKAERKPFVECKTRSQYEIALRNRNQDDSQSMVYFNPLVVLSSLRHYILEGRRLSLLI